MTDRTGKWFRINGSRMEDETTCVVCLPAGFVYALLSISERLTWTKQWINDENEPMELSLKGRDVLDLAIGNLINMSDIIVNNNITSGESGCGCGCGDNGIGTPPPNNTGVEPMPIPPTGEILDDGTTNPDPENFNDYDAYRTYKCAVAAQMVDDVTNSVEELQALGGLLALGTAYFSTVAFTGATYAGIVSGLAAVGLSTGAGIFLIGAALVAIAIFGASVFVHFQPIAAELRTNRADIICQVFNAQTEAQVLQVFYDRMGVAVSNLVVEENVKDVLSKSVNQIIDALLPSEVVVFLFQFVANVGKTAEDCSNCGQVALDDEFELKVEACAIVAVNGVAFINNDLRLIDDGADCNGTQSWNDFYNMNNITGDGARANTGVMTLTHPVQAEPLTGKRVLFDVYHFTNSTSTIDMQWVDANSNVLSVETINIPHGLSVTMTYPAGAYRFRMQLNQNTAVVNVRVRNSL